MEWQVDKIPAFCINLEKRPDRWKEFSKQPGVQQLPNVKRFLGVDGSKLDIMNDERIPLFTKKNIMKTTRRSHEEISTVGAVGCALSHISTWEWIVQNQSPITLIFEDDAKVPANFVSSMNQVIQKSTVLKDPSQWELLTLTGDHPGHIPVKSDPYVAEIEAFIGFQCYFITLSCAQRFLKEAYTLHLHIDLWTAVFKQVHGLKLISLPSLVVGQRTSKTDVQEASYCKICDINPSFYKTHQMIRLEELWLTRAMEVALVATILYASYRFITRKP